MVWVVLIGSNGIEIVEEHTLKKILIFSHAMEIGGAERALLGLLETIDTTKYDIMVPTIQTTSSKTIVNMV